MIYSFQTVEISTTTFLLIFLAGILFALMLWRVIVFLPRIRKGVRKRYQQVRENFSLGPEVHLRNDVYRFAQKQHIASTLFSLDEIIIEPRVLTPLIQSPGSIEHAPTDITSLTIPYIPDWPELSAAYNASTMTFIEALQGGANIILAGHPGYGKTVALAWLATKISRNEKGLGKLANLLPLYVHATDIPHIFDIIINPQDSSDLELSEVDVQKRGINVKKADEVLDLIIQAISTYVSPITLTRLSRIIQSALENQQAILLIDRLDELAPVQARVITEYLRLLLEKYPGLRIIVALSYDDLAGFPQLGFSLLGLASWTDAEYSKLIQRWNQLWTKWIAPIDKSKSKKINPYFLKSWLGTTNTLLKPLEFTLKVWAAYSGDLLGADGPSVIEAYIRRMTHNLSENRSGLERFALQLLTEMNFMSNPNDPDRLISEYKAAIKSTESKADDENQVSPNQLSIKLPVGKIVSEIDLLTTNGFMLSHSGLRIGFNHPVIFGYLAGRALSEYGVTEQLEKQPSWIGKNISLYYLSRYGDVTSLIQNFLQEDDFLHTNHLLISRWLQVAPKNRPWRSIILRTLTTILQKERDTVSLSAKVISALAFSGDVGVSLYFRQLLKSEHPNLKQLAALGCGILVDKNAIDDLAQIVQEPLPNSIRAASLALAAIGDKRSLEILAANMLNGDDTIRRYSAEALANNSTEGHPALREGSSIEDLLVRRAAIFGLIRINRPWATKIVEDLQLEDNEWVVRNAAIQAFDELNSRRNYAPTPLPDLTEAQWLIDFAGKYGTTVAPGKPAEVLVRKALSEGTQDEKLAAMDYLRMKCDPKSADMIYTTYKNSKNELREVAYYILWLMALSGIKLPFGFE